MKQNKVNTVGYATTNAVDYYRPTWHARAHFVSGLRALIRASVIFFVIVLYGSVTSLVQLYTQLYSV
jgi:hypothetical protein